MKELKYSPTLKIADDMRRMSEKGITVTNFTGGTLNDTPQEVKEATKKAIDDGFGSILTDSAGLLGLREAVADRLASEEGIRFDPRREIIVTVGAKGAILMAFQVSLDPGDEVLIVDPFWPSYESLAGLAGGTAKRVPMEKKDGRFMLDGDAILRAIGTRSKMLILNTPHNPTGRVLTKEEIGMVCEIAKAKDLIVLSDECYKELLYDDNKHYTIASFPGMQDRTIIVYSFSKAHAMFGWRVGYAAANEDVVNRMIAIQSNVVSCPTSFAQKGSLAAISDDEPRVAERLKGYRKLRDITVKKLNEVEGVSCETPEGGFWAFPDVSKIADPEDALVDYLLNEHRIGVTPGTAFGEKGRGHFRICYFHEDKYLLSGLKRLQDGIRNYAKKIHR